MSTSVDCCGGPKVTLFCPDCGRRLQEDPPLFSLMIHCAEQSKKYHKISKKNLGYFEAAVEDGMEGEKAERYKGFQEAADICARRWGKWRDAVKEIQGIK